MKNISARLKEKMDAIKNNQGNIDTSVANTELKAVNPFDSLYSEEDFSYINEILEEEDLREFLKYSYISWRYFRRGISKDR